jgi:hypothetical protein
MDGEKILKILLTGFFLVVLVSGLGFSPQNHPTIIAGPSTESRTNPGFYLPIIPGSVGFGMETPAGSGPDRVGGEILHVTTLADSGPGSLREAILAKGPRIVVFDVSGYIHLESNIRISEPYLTIAGQTAPSPGISIKDAGIVIAAHDILVQHIRIRVGDDANGLNPVDSRAIIIYNRSKEDHDVFNVVIDHVSASWAIDENLATWYEGVHDITVINSITSESLWHSSHPAGPHSTGFLVGHGTYNLSVIGNLFAHNDQRNMYVHGDTSTLFVNNLIYNWYGASPQGGASVYGRGRLDATIAGNVYIKGLDTRRLKSIPVYLWESVAEGSRVYLKDNEAIEKSENPWTVSVVETPHPIKVDVAPVWAPSLVVKKSGDVKSWVLRNAGARPGDRDEVDLRIINDVKNGTGRIIDSQDDVGGWPSLTENVRGSGGIPELDIPSNPNEIQPGGYTKLEKWLQELAAQVDFDISSQGK